MFLRRVIAVICFVLVLNCAESLNYVQIFRDDFTVPWNIDQSKWNLITAPSKNYSTLHKYRLSFDFI